MTSTRATQFALYAKLCIEGERQSRLERDDAPPRHAGVDD